MSELTDLIEGVINGSSDKKLSSGTPGNDGLPKEGSTPASKAPKMKGKVGAPPVVATDPEVKNKDAAKVSHQTKKAKEPRANVAGGDTSPPQQGSSKESTPNNKSLGEEEEFDFDDEDSSNEAETLDMYNSPVHVVDGDSKIYDDSDDRTSLVNDQVRVYKGGSWKDREYWLDPAQRRYYPEDMATDYIGFRCAMSRVGSKSLSKKKKKN